MFYLSPELFDNKEGMTHRRGCSKFPLQNLVIYSRYSPILLNCLFPKQIHFSHVLPFVLLPHIILTESILFFPNSWFFTDERLLIFHLFFAWINYWLTDQIRAYRLSCAKRNKNKRNTKIAILNYPVSLILTVSISSNKKKQKTNWI